ncbi:uncharacterized protein PGTG_22699 [Puccinia graminis f. sp. tritici CRL 75-36-700-3]|uniref:Uncharacterized protein n=1 Tax=Puccinia graminis f. sp. tritici (strain CRL 75-36-700-3 / race SCCL) TaxID=418459 RepID=H6QVA9_PUCGT|nr:uncharacterized protein PGTG_22699 [Puccinia graminis f. sp. tritici CRL 75-36-700-3]EHS62838.1 hypothetical protein PGTG_22699 [Puccinia graminis f. sp. tritici CRL 75-36-700-3]
MSSQSIVYSGPTPLADKLSYHQNIPQRHKPDGPEEEQPRLEQQKSLQEQPGRLEQPRFDKEQQCPMQEPTLQQQQQQQHQQQQNPEPENQSQAAGPHQQKSQLTQKQKELLPPAQRQESRFSPQFFKSALKKVELHNSVSSNDSFESPGKDEDWHLSLRKSALNPMMVNHYSTGPILPPQFDLKAKKVSNIVDLFEKAQPESPPRDNNACSLSSYSITEHRAAPSPIRIPVRSLKLSRVGEQEEK